MGQRGDPTVDPDIIRTQKADLATIKRNINLAENLKRAAFTLAVALIISPAIYYYYFKPPAAVFATVLLCCIAFSFLAFVLGISWRAEKFRLEAITEELQFEIDLLKYPVQNWEIRAEKTLLQNDKRLRRYYDQNLGENNKLFYVGILCIILGTAILGATLYTVYALSAASMDAKIIVASLGAVGSLLTNYVAAIYLKLHAAASRNLGTFHGRLVDTHQVLLASMIASRIDDDAKRWGTYANVAEYIVTHEPKRTQEKKATGEDSDRWQYLAKLIEDVSKPEKTKTEE
jgi:hypothetical protein